MTEELHNNNELPVSAAEGWMQMEALLNKNLPVKRVTYISVLFACLPALLLCSIFMFSSLRLDTYLFHTTVYENANNVGFNTSDKFNSSFTVNFDTRKSTYLPGRKIVEKKSDTALLLNDQTELPIAINHETDIDAGGRIERVSKLNFINDISERKNKMSIPVNAPTAFNIHPNLVDVNKHQRKKSMEFAAGIGMNIAAGERQNLQPYPVAEVKYNLSSRFYIAAGLSLLSPVAGNVSGISKTVYVNDTVNNISLYNEVVSYDHLSYIDLPLSVGVNINKKWMFQSGLQLSVLVNKRQKNTLQPYDFQMNNIDMPFSSPLVGLAANPHQEFDVGIRNIDYRFIAGIKYKQNRTTAGLFYQHTLPSAALSNNKSTISKGLFTFNLMYQIK